MIRHSLLLSLCGALAVSAAQPAAPFPAPKNLGDPATLGLNIQRTMTLLATSTPVQRNTVRVLFYGQSITEQEWTKEVTADLRRRFPNANLLIENRAIGGHSSQLLVKTAEADLYPFQPDLMIFYVYGSHTDYESIIRRTRERTTAEILMQTDHATKDSDLTEPTDPAKVSPAQWNSFMNYKFLPETARKYGCGLVDQRNLWKQYLKETGLSATNLLKDGVHLNAHGNYLMAEMVKAQLVHRPDVKMDPMNCDTVKTLPSGQDFQWKDGKITFPFDGTRVDLIGLAANVSVRIDGKKPSEIPELYSFTRVSGFPGSSWPCLLKVDSQKPRLAEDWTLAVTEASPDLKTLKFELTGSKTGPDGAGTRAENFVSKSGRVAINTNDWNLDFCYKVFKRTLPANHKMKWRAVLNGQDDVKPAGAPAPGIESATTLAHGLPNGKHTLELLSDSQPTITALRVYRPSMK